MLVAQTVPSGFINSWFIDKEIREIRNGELSILFHLLNCFAASDYVWANIYLVLPGFDMACINQPVNHGLADVC